MSAAAVRSPMESIPIEHETYERVIRIIAFGAPPAALVMAGLGVMGRVVALA